jgi:hypothetical protein
VALGVLVPAAVVFMVWGNWMAGGNGPGGSMFGPAVALLFVLTAINRWLGRHHPRWVFTAGELVAVYTVVAITGAMTGSAWDWFGALAPAITYPAWLASPSNGWADTMLPNIPAWLVITDREVLRGFYVGDSTPYRAEVLRAWVTPAFWWTTWTMGLLWVTLCLNVIVRRRWSEEEKLPFPMTELPLRLVEPSASLWRQPLWWCGVGAAVLVGAVAILGRFFPSVPALPQGVDLSGYISNNPPWNALRNWRLSWTPWSIGLSYLMPVDLGFSLVVFNLLWRAEYVLARLFGWNVSSYSGFPYGDQQTIGAYLAMLAAVLWLDRRYLGQVLRKVAGLSSPLDDREEAFSYRTAVLGALGGGVFLYWFLGRAGLGGALGIAFLVLYFAMMMAMSRIRAQLGPPDHEMVAVTPEYVFVEFPGMGAIPPRGLGTIAVLRPYMNEQRTNPTPTQLEGLRMAERVGVGQRRLAWLMMAIVPLAMTCYFWANLAFGYSWGLEAKGDLNLIYVSQQVTQKLDGWLRNPNGPEWGGVEAIGFGALVTVLLTAAKMQLSWWPLHPVAFPLAFSYPIEGMLPAIILSLSVKALLLRYGGLRAHRQALPLFLGLIAGSALIVMVQYLLFRSLGVQ